MSPEILIISQDNKKELKIKNTRITDATSKRIAKVLRDEASAEQAKDGHASDVGIKMCEIAHLLDPQ